MIASGIVPKEAIHDLWPTVEPLLAPAIDRAGGRMSMETVRETLEGNTHLLWIATDEDEVLAACVTRTALYPLKKMLVVESLGGRQMKRWVNNLNDTLIRYAKETGHDGLELYGRTGWVKALMPYGWKHSMVVCEVKFDLETPDVQGS